jgi:CHAT domain-containing protein
MLYQLLRYIVLILLLQSNGLLFAQSDAYVAKLDSLKAKNDLTNWIYEQLDKANDHPQIATNLITQAQRQAWRKTKTADEHFAWLNLLSTLGYYQLLDGKILQSIQSYESALLFFRKYQVLSYNVVEYVIKPLSNNYTRLGDYERAIYLQKQGIEFANNKDEAAAIHANMAISYRSMSHLDNAYQVVAKGVALQPSKAIRIMLNNILADVMYDDEKYAEAAAVIRTNMQQQKATNAETAYWLIGSYTTAGNIYQKQNQPSLANQYYTKALRLIDQYFVKQRLRERANLYTKMASAYLAQSNFMAANSYAKKALSTLNIVNEKGEIVQSQIYGDNTLVDVFMVLSKTHRLLNQPDQTLKYIDLALLTADKIRDEFAANVTEERLQNELKKIVEQGIDISYQLYQRTKKKSYLDHVLELAEQSKARTLLDQIRRNQQQLIRPDGKKTELLKKQQLEQQISYLEKQLIETGDKRLVKEVESLKFDLALVDKTIAKKYQGFAPSDQIAIDLQALPSHRFIEYFIGQHSTYVINICQNRVVDVIKLPNAEDTRLTIGNFVKTYFHQGPSAMMNNPQQFFNASFEIYKLILAPIKLKPNERITIIPDGVLGYLSFDGLICNRNYTENISQWPFLIHHYLIDYGFSIKTIQAKKQQHSDDGFSGIFLTHQQRNQAQLTNITKEADLISKEVGGTFLFDDDVNLSAFNGLFANSSILHIGTHAYLSGPNKEPTLDLGKEKLYLFELSNTANAPNLVVLSACQTADGVLANGEGIISMARGFNAVGSLATIASLWNVNDEAAATITANFYKQLSVHKDPVLALHKAKLSWVQSEKLSNSMLLPYYWDSLIYMGKNQELVIKKPYQWKWIITSAGLVAVVACLFYFIQWKKSLSG